MKKAVYAGSFDPITNGHLWMIERGADLFDHLTVAVGINPDKRYTFTLDERLEMVKGAVNHIDNVTVDDFHNQFLVRYAKSQSAQYILRGIRGMHDYEFERGMRHINHDLQPSISTIFLMPPREITEISSSLVKGLIGPDDWQEAVKPYVPKSVYKAILQNMDK